MSKFQFIILGAFVVAIIAGVITFASFKGRSSNQALPAITVWGTFPADTFNQYVNTINNSLPQRISVTYVQESPQTFSQDFVAALARGKGPDGILIPADMILPHEDKLALIPYSALSQRAFIDAYIQEAQIYLSQNGILAIPFAVDPFVMYWNRDLFSAAGLAAYPKTWDDFTALNKALTIKDQNGTVTKSAVAMGAFSNITNARELFGTLLMQSGNPVTTVGADGLPVSTLKVAAKASPIPALTFFSQFANPSDPNYSWNRAMQNDKTSFLSGTLATYFGLASELGDIRDKNPDLNFDVAPMPQQKPGSLPNGKASKVADYARLYGFSIANASLNKNAAYQVISILTSPANLSLLSQMTYLPTVASGLDQGSNDPYIANFDKAALIGSTWLDADPAASRQIMGDMVDAFVSGQKNSYQAIQDAGNQYDAALRQAVGQ